MLPASKKLSVFFIFIAFLVLREAFAVDFYKDCVKSYQLNDHDSDPIELTPLSKICVDRCNTECGSFSRKYSTSENPEDEGTELNDDVIYNCMTECKAGRIFTSAYYEVKPRENEGDPIETQLMPPASTGAACTESADILKNNAVRTAFKIAPDDLLRISLSGRELNNKIYLCGRKAISLIPTFPNISSSTFNINTSDWDSNTKPQTEWTQKSDNKCFSNLTDSQWNDMTNRKLWEGYINDSTYGACSWNARNPNFANTGIPIADGDELKLEWSGDYSAWSEGKFGREELMQCINYETDADQKAECKYRLERGTAIVIKNQMQSDFNYSDPNQNHLISGESVRPADHYFGIHNPESSEPTETKQLGLTGKFLDHGIKTEFQQTAGCDPNVSEDYEKPECIKILDFGTTLYLYSGILSGFGTNRSNMGVAHYDLNANSNNIGGLNLKIEWGGCAFMGGERIQYAIFEELIDYGEFSDPYTNIPDIPESYWKDVPSDTLKEDKPITISNEQGRLFLRIKTLTPPSGSSSEIADLYTKPENYYGQYYVIVQREKQSNVKMSEGPFTKLINIVRHTLLGKNREFGSIAEEGVIYNMYTGVVNNSGFIRLTQMVLIFYIATLGLGMTLGISKINQQDLLMRLLKVALIITLISPGSWEFFCGYLVPLCIDGVMEVIAIFLAGSYPLAESGYTEEQILQNPEYMFELFDGPLQQLFSSAVWKKIVALLFSGIAGFLLSVAVIISIAYYLLMLVKAVLLYMIALIFMAMLIVSAPIFILLSLFEITKQAFSQWAKFLISFALQPIAVMILFALFNLLLSSLLQTALAFTACPGCFLYVDLIFYKACWIPYFYPILDLHLPPSISTAFISPANIGTILALLMVSNASFILISHIVVVISNITTGSFLRTATITSPTKEGTRITRDTFSQMSSVTSGTVKQLVGGASKQRSSIAQPSTNNNQSTTQNRGGSGLGTRSGAGEGGGARTIAEEKK